MPIENTINHEDRIIYSKCTGVMKKEDFDLYIKNIWTENTYYGFNEIFDTVDADWDNFDFSYLLEVAKTAEKLKTLDPNSKLAWIVLEGKQKELTNFYKAAKSLSPSRGRSLEAFFSENEAYKWLNKSE